MNTGQRKILQRRFATVLFGNDVVGFMGKQHAEAGDKAIFATTGRPIEIGDPKRLRAIASAHAALRKCCQAAALIEVTR